MSGRGQPGRGTGCFKDIPQVGKLGLAVTWPARNGLVRSILVTPKKPRTDRQIEVRELLVQQRGEGMREGAFWLNH